MGKRKEEEEEAGETLSLGVYYSDNERVCLDFLLPRPPPPSPGEFTDERRRWEEARVKEEGGFPRFDSVEGGGGGGEELSHQTFFPPP